MQYREGCSVRMGRRQKKAAGGKVGGVAKPASAAAAKPPRARNFDHLKNKKLHGLQFGLTQRNNILIDCWAADRVPPGVIMECFEKAGIYPPGASAALVDDASNRHSRRIQKVEASKELQRIANDKTLSTDQIITQSSVVLEDIMELSKYEQLPPEMLCPRKRQKKRHKQGSISPSQSQSPLRHAYQNVTGNFSPRAMLEISDSFAAEREEWSKVRQFVCTVEGCKFGLKGAPSRFSGEGYLRGHMKQKHGVTLAPMDAGAVKELKRLQVAAAGDTGKNRTPLPATAADDSSESASSDVEEHADFYNVLHQCVLENQLGHICGYTSDEFDVMLQHHWVSHPDCVFGPFRWQNMHTQEILSLDAPDEPYNVDWAHMMVHWLGSNRNLFTKSLMAACWLAIEQDAQQNEGEPDYDRVCAALEESGFVRPGFENAVVHPPASTAPTAPAAAKSKQSVKGSSKIRRCSLCSQTGHDRRKCPVNVELTPIHSPSASPPAAGTPATKQHSPSPFQPSRFSTPSPFRRQLHGETDASMPAKRESHEQTNEPAKRSCSLQ
jgi:hypothetical protein